MILHYYQDFFVKFLLFDLNFQFFFLFFSNNELNLIDIIIRINTNVMKKVIKTQFLCFIILEGEGVAESSVLIFISEKSMF